MTYINRLEEPIIVNDKRIDPEVTNLSMKPREDTLFIVPNRVWTRNRRQDIVTPDPKNTTTMGGVVMCGGLLVH